MNIDQNGSLTQFQSTYIPSIAISNRELLNADQALEKAHEQELNKWYKLTAHWIDKGEKIVWLSDNNRASFAYAFLVRGPEFSFLGKTIVIDAETGRSLFSGLTNVSQISTFY